MGVLNFSDIVELSPLRGVACGQLMCVFFLILIVPGRNAVLLPCAVVLLRAGTCTLAETTFANSASISADASMATGVFAADVNGNGYIDVLAALQSTGIMWYQNMDGTGTFSGGALIGSPYASRSVCAADFDGDNDVDVAYASKASNLVRGETSWYRNMDGEGARCRANTKGMGAACVAYVSILPRQVVPVQGASKFFSPIRTGSFRVQKK